MPFSCDFCLKNRNMKPKLFLGITVCSGIMLILTHPNSKGIPLRLSISEYDSILPPRLMVLCVTVSTHWRKSPNLQPTLSNYFFDMNIVVIWYKSSLKSVRNIQITNELDLNKMMTHICGTGPRWVQKWPCILLTKPSEPIFRYFIIAVNSPSWVKELY